VGKHQGERPDRQTKASELRLHPHLHGVFLDGVYEMGPEGIPVFRALSRLSTSDVADVMQITRARVLQLLSRRGVVAAGAEAIELTDSFADREPVLAQLAAAASTGLAPAGPELRRGRHDPIALRGRPGVRLTKDRCVEEMGFTLHANTCAGDVDERGREALLEYILRPPIANENVQQGPEGLVRIVLKRPFSDGTTAIDMDPLSLLSPDSASKSWVNRSKIPTCYRATRRPPLMRRSCAGYEGSHPPPASPWPSRCPKTPAR
jgi:hypothetical protein